MRNRPALTLVELIVVVLVAAIAIGLLIPALARFRNSDTRLHCANNLKQIGLALNDSQDANKAFPAGYVTGVNAQGRDTGPGWGWATSILAFVHQKALADQIKLDQPISEVAARIRPIATYRCPADRAAAATWMSKKYENGVPIADLCELAEANYVGVSGIAEPGGDGDGMLYRNSAVTLKQVVDGTSNTLFVGERASLLANATWVGAVPGAQLDSHNSAAFVLGHTGHMKSPAEPTEASNFSSEHPGGVNFLYVDGHVQFLTGSMSAGVLQALSTRAGREAVPGK